MMQDNPFGRLLSSFSMEWIFVAAKAALVLGFFVYFVFALVAVVQIKRMFTTLNTGAEGLFLAMGWLHLLVSGLALVWAIVIV